MTEAMSIGSADQMEINGDLTLVTSLTKSLLVSLSEILTSVVSIKVENNSFLEIGCYLYRTIPHIIELQATENIPTNLMEILHSVTKRIDLAKNILIEVHKNEETMPNRNLNAIIKQLEGVITHIGEDLSLIPPATFDDEKYIEIVMRSLSEEMKGVKFDGIVVQENESRNQESQPEAMEEEINGESTLTESESDLYSISTIVYTDNSHVSDMRQLVEALRSASQSSHRSQGSFGSSLTSLPQATRYVEPLYNSFFCPLTKEIMDDPVTIESGVTYERNAITEYFEKIGDPEEAICPVTRQKLMSKVMSPNIALSNTIKEWKDRNETGRIKVIRAALSVGSTDSMILEALKDLQNICQRSPRKVAEVHKMGIIPLLVKLLELRDRKVRRAALETLRILAEDDDGKDLIGKTPALSTTMKMLSSSYQPIRHAALLLLIEFSKSQTLVEKMGWVTGGILLLIKTKYNRSTDAFASEAAHQVLRNLERCQYNIRCMAENGYLDPLLNNLVQGCEDTKLEMATYLGEIVLGDDSKIYVAEKASPAFMLMLHSGNTLIRKAAFKALAHISTYRPNGRMLIEAGIVQIMIQELFTRKIYNEPMDSLTEASTILANILESGPELENLKVNNQGHNMASGYVLFNIIYMIKSTTSDELNFNLIRILSCLTKMTKSAAPIVSALKESEACYTLVELLNSPSDKLAIAAVKLLINLTPHMGHMLIDRLCKTNGQPEGLIQSPMDPAQITERQALSVNFLAKLPHQNLTLNLTLLSKNTVPTILQTIDEIRKTGTRTSRYARPCLEGLVGVLVRFTITLYEPQMLFLAMNYNFTEVFTDLLTETSSEVQKLAAQGLEKLSSQSVTLSKPPKPSRKKYFDHFLPDCLSFKSSKESKVALCQVHKGACSPQNTFCLIEARVVERLLACLDQQDAEVVEAALSALCTLLDEKVDVDKSVNMLIEMNGIQQVLKAVREHKNENMWQKAFWMVEKFLVKSRQTSISAVMQDKFFAVSLVSAFHHGDAYTKQMAEKILRHLDKMPSFTSTFTT